LNFEHEHLPGTGIFYFIFLHLCQCHTPLAHMHLAVSQQQIISARHGTQTTRGVTARLQIKPNFNRTTGLACGGGGGGGGGTLWAERNP
jgi:hypothetical protein